MANPTPSANPTSNSNPYLDDSLIQIQRDFNPVSNKEFEDQHQLQNNENIETSTNQEKITKCKTKPKVEQIQPNDDSKYEFESTDSQSQSQSTDDTDTESTNQKLFKKYRDRLTKKFRERQQERSQKTILNKKSGSINVQRKENKKTIKELFEKRRNKRKQKNDKLREILERKTILGPNDRKTRAHEPNTNMLISNFMRSHEDILSLNIPKCINAVTFNFFFEPTDVKFNYYDKQHINSFVSISNDEKILQTSYKTVFIFSNEGYKQGKHRWSILCKEVGNCQAIGIVEKKNAEYRFGNNIFDSALNGQLGDRYIYAGDRGHSWRGSTEHRPYICTVNEDQLQYYKDFKLDNNLWKVGDIITVELDFSDEELWTVQFFKNAEELTEKIGVIKKCLYYPVFQVHRSGLFEIIDE